jgi:hypothetical protein
MMVSFKQFLLSEEVITDEEEMIERIKTECAPFLKEIDFIVKPGIETASFITRTQVPRALWRGASHDAALVKLSGKRTRHPADTAPEMHELLVRHLTNQFGWPYRAMGVFCSTAAEQAAGYGDDLFMVFPIGEYEYIYAPSIRDAYEQLDNHLIHYPKMWKEILSSMGKKESEYERDGMQEPNWSKWYELVYDYLEKNTPYTNANLKHALNEFSEKGIEVVLKCDNYYALCVGPRYRANAIQVLMGISK